MIIAFFFRKKMTLFFFLFHHLKSRTVQNILAKQLGLSKDLSLDSVTSDEKF